MGFVVFRDGLEENADSAPKISTTVDGHIVESYTVNKEPRFFVTLSGSHYCAHGDTLADAISDAIWKDDKRRPSLEALKAEIQKAGIDRKISLPEFRLLTGACAVGCRVALKEAELDGSPMSTKEILKYFPDWGRKLSSILWDQK
jgi:hypothetical protein